MIKELNLIDEKFNRAQQKEKFLYLKNNFLKNGYVVYENLLSEEEVSLLFEYTKLKRNASKWINKYCVGEYPNSFTKPIFSKLYFGLLGELDFKKETFSLSGDAFTDTLLNKYKNIFEKVSGEELYNTTSFLRFYVKGDKLLNHTDRGELAVSGTIHVGGNQWELGMKDLSGNNKNINLRPGDCLIYQGHNCQHWREPLEGKECLQVFLHYTPTKNEYFKYDRREGLGLPPVVTSEKDLEFKKQIGLGGYIEE